MSSYHLSEFDSYEDSITKQDWNETELTEDDISESVYENDWTADDKSEIENKMFQKSNSKKNKGSPTKPKENNTRSAKANEKR